MRSCTLAWICSHRRTRLPGRGGYSESIGAASVSTRRGIAEALWTPAGRRHSVRRHVRGGSMDFTPSPKVKELRDRIAEFMDRWIYPAEAEVAAQADLVRP